jgi:hypothetical protein
MGPVDFAAARRKADRDELERAKAAGDWGAALDVIHANLHEVESLCMRSYSKHEETNRLIGDIFVRIGDLVDAMAKAAPAPVSYRPSLASANNLDAQALATTIENVDRQHRGSITALGDRLGAVEARIGDVPDPTKGRKGSGIAEIVHRLDSNGTIAKLLLLVAIAGAAGAQLTELIKWLAHLKG